MQLYSSEKCYFESQMEDIFAQHTYVYRLPIDKL